MSTVSSIQNTGSTETLLIKLELHFEGFSLYPLGAFLNVVTNLSPSQSFHHTSYHPMYGNPDISIVEMFTFGIRNTSQGIRNPIKECNPEDSQSGIQVPLTIFRIQYLELEIHGVEFRDSKTVLDTLTWGESKVK